MAKFTRMKPIFNGDGVSGRKDFVVGGGAGIGSGLRLTDVSLNLLHFNKRKLTRITDPTRTRILASLSSSSSKSSSSSSSSSPSSSSSAKKSNMKEAKSNHAIDAIYEEILGDPEYESDDLSCFRGLVLDISYRPINVVCWKRAICLEFMAKADVLEYYDQTVNSPSGSFYIPAVLRVPHLLQVVKRRRVRNTLSRKNIISRDNFSCQYCSSGENLTIDHVLPISRGGEWTWENLVTACLSCNSKKGQKTLEEANMKLLKAPKAPKDYDIVAIPLTNTAIKMLKMRKGTPEEWLQYLAKPAP